MLIGFGQMQVSLIRALELKIYKCIYIRIADNFYFYFRYCLAQKSVTRQTFRQVIRLYRQCHYLFNIINNLSKKDYAYIFNSMLLVIILLGFCLAECFKDCGFVVTSAAAFIVLLMGYMIANIFKLSSLLKEQSETFSKLHRIYRHHNNRRLIIWQKKALTSCTPLTTQIGSYLKLSKSTFLFLMYSFVINGITTLLFTY